MSKEENRPTWIIHVTKVTVSKASLTVEAEDEEAAWAAVESLDADRGLEWDGGVIEDVSYEVEEA